MRTQSDEEVSNRQEVKTAEEIDSDCIRWGRALARSKTGIQDYNETERELEDLAARGHSVPVYVMLPLDAIWLEEKVTRWPRRCSTACRGVRLPSGPVWTCVAVVARRMALPWARSGPSSAGSASAASIRT